MVKKNHFKKISNPLLPYSLLLWQVPETKVKGEQENSSLAAHKPIKTPLPLAVNSYCHGFKRNVKHLVIWCQSHQTAFVPSTHAYCITKYTKPTIPEGKPLPSPKAPPWRVFLTHFSFFLSLKSTCLMQSFTFPPTNRSSLQSQHGVYLPQEAMVYKTWRWENVLIAKCWKTLLPKPGQWNISAEWIKVWTDWQDVWMLKIMILKARSTGCRLGSPGVLPFKPFGA